MEISILIAIFVTVTGAMYKLKQDYEDFYDKKLSRILLIVLTLLLTGTLSYSKGINDTLSIVNNLSTPDKSVNTLEIVDQILVLTLLFFVAWLTVLFLPTKKEISK
ncbi:hypothetical protein KWB77_003550 [Vibrio cholerae]|nr:hypothetical protein [Vibrio cholerae]